MFIKAGLLRNKSILISVIIILIFLVLPWVFTETASSNPDTQVSEEVELVKRASDLLSPQMWWYLLPLSVFLLCLSFYFASRDSSVKPMQDSNIASVTTAKGLVVRGVLTLEAYFFFFLLPFPLHRYYDLSRVSMGWIADRSWVAAITLSFAMVALFLLYTSAYRLTLRQNTRRMWFIVLFGAFLFALVNFFVFPISSTDLYDYVSRGRMSGIYGGNPLVQVPNDFPFDSYVQLAAWKKDPSAYGPLWEVISGLIGRFVGAHLWKDMLGYKALAFISYLLSTLTIASILRTIMPNRSLAGTLLFAWNPLILLDGIANAHNDMLMVAFILGAFWILSQASKDSLPHEHDQSNLRNLIYGCLALVFLTLAILIKFIPILLIPIFLFYLISQIKNLKRKTIYLILSLLPVILVIFLYYRVFWDWPEISNAILQRTEMFRTSLASLTKLILGIAIQQNWAQGIASSFFLVAFGLGYLLILAKTANALGIFPSLLKRLRNVADSIQARLLKRSRSLKISMNNGDAWTVLISASLYTLLLYLLLASLWFWPWYLIWPLALLALSKEERLSILLIVVSCAGQLTFILWNFVWYWMGIEWDTLYVVETLALGLMIVPTLVLYLIYRRQRQVVTIISERRNENNNIS
jgi:alpha-1,6-mannosyltransferase